MVPFDRSKPHTGHGQVANQYGISALQGKKARKTLVTFLVKVQRALEVVCVR